MEVVTGIGGRDSIFGQYHIIDRFVSGHVKSVKKQQACTHFLLHFTSGQPVFFSYDAITA